MLSGKASAEPGPWRTSRTPYLREPMDCLSTGNPTQRVVMMFAAQTGKTECGSNWLGYVIDHAPGPMLCVQPTVEMAKRLSKQRLESMINETPCLMEKISPARSRDSGNTLFSKEFAGGIMILTGSNSGTGLRSTPCRYLFLDEVDAFPADVDGEGDPVGLAEKRSTTFARRKILLTSTPTIKDFSRIEAEFLRSDQRFYHISCPFCGHMQPLKFSQLKWEGKDPSTASYECEHCGDRFEELHKTELLRKGEWRATAPGDGKTAGFHLNGLYSPLGWFSWSDMVDEFLKAKNDAPALKTWTNTRMAETWSEAYVSKVSAEGLLTRVEPYTPGLLPDGVLCVVQGVDCQLDRLEISTWGYGVGEECWLIEHQVLSGDPHRPEVWKQLDVLLQHEWKFANSDRKLRTDCMAIDSGGLHTHEVYQYTRERQALGAIAVKGQSVRNKPPIGRATKVDINFAGKQLKKSGRVYPMGSDSIKSVLMGRLRHNEPGPGYLHFHAETGSDYFEQLVAERQILKTNRQGFQTPEWTLPSGRRNECLDCAVMAYAALHHLYQRYDRRTIWEQFLKRLEGNAMGSQRSPTKLKTAKPGGYVHNW